MTWKKLKKLHWPVTALVVATVGTGALFIAYNNLDWSNLLSLSFYENLANPSVRVVRIQEGLRKEEVADALAKDLGWNGVEKSEFLGAHLALGKSSLEGYYFPTTYLINRNDSPVSITQAMVSKFQTETNKIKKPTASALINSDTALKVASIIQREAAGKADMRLISGILWNRIFKGMKLQVDATLQYAKGDEEEWWPPVEPSDKKINSPYNTYINTNLPPTPISNPGLAAIEAAYNPLKTNCIFYIHDKNRNIHCSATYEGQLNNVDKYY